MQVVISDENKEAIKEYQAMGRPRALRNMIALSNMDLVKWAVNKKYYCQTNRDIEELEQEAFILMLEAIDKYDPEKSSFSTFYLLYIQNITRKSIEYNQEVSLDKPIPGFEGDNITIADTIEDTSQEDIYSNIDKQDEDRNIREELKASLDDREQYIIFSIYGIEITKIQKKELAEVLGVHPSTVTEQIRKIERKLRGNKKLKYIYSEYEDITFINSGSFIPYGSKTNKISDLIFESTAKKLALIEKMKRSGIDVIKTYGRLKNTWIN